MIEMVGSDGITKVSRVFALVYAYTSGRGSSLGTHYEAIGLEVSADWRPVRTEHRAGARLSSTGREHRDTRPVGTA